MNNNYYCIIMAGGYANHFWPITRESRPKQFLDMAGSGRTFIQAAYDRCIGVVPDENILVITLDKYKDLVKEQLPELKEDNLLLEPYGRNTAPCIAYAMYTLLKRNPEAVMAVTPADLVISDIDTFHRSLTNALDYAAQNPVLVTLGVVPDHPDPNFGYIQVLGGKGAYLEDKPMKVKTFTEKPNIELAQVFCNSGEFFWNSGIFVWQAEVIHEELRKYTPAITKLFHGWQDALGTPAEPVFLERAYTDCIKLSIDYGVMEKTDKAWLYPAKFGWSDIDSWESLCDHLPKKDENDNVCNIPGSLIENAHGNIIVSDKKSKLIALTGLEDYIVIDTDDVLMICPKEEKAYKDFIAKTAMPQYKDYR